MISILYLGIMWWMIIMTIIVLFVDNTNNYYFSFYTTCFGLIYHSQVFYSGKIYFYSTFHIRMYINIL
jgi:hypothetical protein